MGVQRKAYKRKQYTNEFKREAVRLVTEGGLSMAQVARDLGLNDNMVSRWKKEAEKNGSVLSPAKGTPKMRSWPDYGVKTTCCVKSTTF